MPAHHILHSDISQLRALASFPENSASGNAPQSHLPDTYSHASTVTLSEDAIRPSLDPFTSSISGLGSVCSNFDQYSALSSCPSSMVDLRDAPETLEGLSYPSTAPRQRNDREASLTDLSMPFAPSEFSEVFPPSFSSAIDQTAVPNSREVQQLARYFIDHCHDLLPILDHNEISRELQTRDTGRSSGSVLLYAILTASATVHPDCAVRQRRSVWNRHLSEAMQQPEHLAAPSLRSIQSALWMTFLCYNDADVQLAWMHLGYAWRMACSLGLNVIDAPADSASTDFNSQLPYGREEVRRTMWGLFTLDASLFGWCSRPSAIDERSFLVKAPSEGEYLHGATVSIAVEKCTSFEN